MVDDRLFYRRLLGRKVKVGVRRLDISNLFRLEVRVGSWLDIRLVIRVVVIYKFGVGVDTRLDIQISSSRLEIRVDLRYINRFLSRLNRRFVGELNYRVFRLKKVRHKSYLLSTHASRLFLRNSHVVFHSL
jgi:hypothetical protein